MFRLSTSLASAIAAFTRAAAITVVTGAAVFSAQAAPVTFAFTGTVSDDPFGLSHVGAAINGSFVFDNAAPDTIADGHTGSYRSSGGAFGFWVQVDGADYSVAGAVAVNTANDIGVDQYGVIALDNTLSLELLFQDSAALALTSDALPGTPPPVVAFDLRQFHLFGSDVEFTGTIDSLQCLNGCSATQPLPEPNMPALIGLALLALCVVRASGRRGRPVY